MPYSTFKNILDRVRSEIIEPTPGFVSDTEIADWINEANSELVQAANIESLTSIPITTVAGQELYDLSGTADFGIALRVEMSDGQGQWWELTPQTLQQRKPMNGTPQGYYILGLNRLGLIPTPDVSGKGIRVFYQKGPVLWNGSDASATPGIPDSWRYLIYWYAVSQAKRKGDDPAYQTYVSDYTNGKTAFLQDIQNAKEGNQSFHVVRMVD